jgi:hypothetical protein
MQASWGASTAARSGAYLPTDPEVFVEGAKRTVSALWWLATNPIAWLAVIASAWLSGTRDETVSRAEHKRHTRRLRKK